MFFIRTVFLFFKLNFLKALLYPVIVSAKDWDRLRFEWELCRISAERSDVLFVGVYSRSFAELVLPFDFIDIDDNFLIKGLTNVSVGRCEKLPRDTS